MKEATQCILSEGEHHLQGIAHCEWLWVVGVSYSFVPDICHWQGFGILFGMISYLGVYVALVLVKRDEI